MSKVARQVAVGMLLINLAMFAQGGDGSAHRHGPHELEGWTLDSTIPDHGVERYPTALLIARRGRIIQRFKGNAFVWNWMFQNDGKQVAYESGPLHFSMTCVLADVATGRQVGTYDCFGELPADAPAWVESLEDWSRKAH